METRLIVNNVLHRPPEIDLSALFKETREALGCTQREMADLLGVPLRTYQKWEYSESIPNGKAVSIVYELRKQLKEQKR